MGSKRTLRELKTLHFLVLFDIFIYDCILKLFPSHKTMAINSTSSAFVTCVLQILQYIYNKWWRKLLVKGLLVLLLIGGFLCEGWQIGQFKLSSRADVQLFYLFYNKKVSN